MLVNGKEVRLAVSTTLENYLKSAGYQAGRIVVEKNGEIIPSKNFGTELLDDRDEIEIVHFVGGG